MTVDGQKVRVQLPEARILSNETGADSVQIFDETSSVFNSFTVEDFRERRAMEERALMEGLLEEARRKQQIVQ